MFDAKKFVDEAIPSIKKQVGEGTAIIGLSGGVDGVVVGSAFVKLIEEKGKKAGKRIEQLARELKSATRL